MLKRGENNKTVLQLQETLINLGYKLPRWGADGDLGEETLGALQQLLTDHGKKFDDDKNTVSDKELDFVYTLESLLKQPKVESFNLFDLRPGSDRKKIIRRRSWKEVTGITLHQTACLMGEKPTRWQNCGAHLGITRAGKTLWIHDFDLAVIHGNGFNGSTVGIEMDGHYAGIKDDMKTYWRPKDSDRLPLHPTNDLIESAKQAIRWIVNEVEIHGGKVKYLVAHRQSSKTRQSDPGSELWQAVALPMHKELKLTDGGKDYKMGTGRPIPEVWDLTKVGVKY